MTAGSDGGGPWTEPHRPVRRLAQAARIAVGAVAGLVAAAVLTLNVHIWVGLEQGYAATPAEVFDRSVALGLVDVAILVGLPVLGAVVTGRSGPTGRR